MGDNEFRSLRRPAVDSSAQPDNEMSDPLAELARLIGQSHPHGDSHPHGESLPQGTFGREDDAADAHGAAPPGRPLDWAGEEYAGQGHEPAPDRRYDRAPAAPRQYSPPLSGDAHNDAHDEPYREGAVDDAPYDEEPAHAGADDAGDYSNADYSNAEYDEGYDETYEEERSRIPRRSRTSSVVLGIVGLIVLGSAGAFGYRALFGGSVFPALPPIIKSSGAPIKIIPKHDSQAAAPSQTAVADAGAGDHLVPHEEQPVEVQAATPGPHSVTTVPVISNTPPDGVLPATQPPVATASAAEPEASGAAAATAEAVPPPKPVRTLTIHTDPSAAGNPTAAGERPARATREADAARPLSIVPGRETEAPSGSRPREAEAGSEESLPSASPPAATGSTAGGYDVQVSSQRSEADAEATFHALQAKYPQQLGSQHGMVRRADLGPKGIYYRALVGPFASAGEASRLCSSLKAAGGSCIIQRN